MQCRHRVSARPLRLGILSIALAAAWTPPGDAGAQAMRFEPMVTSTLTWTNNSNYGDPQRSAEDDGILDVMAGFRLSGGGAQWRISGTLGAEVLKYVNGSQTDELFPRADLSLETQLVPRWLSLNAGILSTRESENVFSPVAENTVVNRFNVTQYRVTPVLDREISPTLRFTARSDNTWTSASKASINVSDGYFARHAIALTAQPAPLGGAVEAERAETRYQDSLNDHLVRDTARAIGTYAFNPQLSLSLVGGYERVDVDLGQTTEQTLYGGRLQWQPTDRTRINATVEHRFFGTGWDMQLSHRTPFLAFEVRWLREASSFIERLYSIPQGANIASLLDAAFTTRFPDAAERARVVQEFLAQRGLSETAPGALNLYSDRLNLYTSLNASVAYLGPRWSSAWAVYRARIEELPPEAGGAPIVVLPVDSEQTGVTWNTSYRLSPNAALVGTLGWVKVNGLGLNDGEHSRQRTARLEFNQVLSPRTTGRIGVRRQLFDSNVNPNSQETGVYVGLTHQF